MLSSLAVVIIISLLMFYLFDRIKLHGLIGLILTGVILGPYVLNLIDPKLLEFSSEFRMLALIIILIRAGLSIKKTELNKIGNYAASMGLVPFFIEAALVAVASFYILDMEPVIAIMFGFIMAPVSPAIIIPQMLGMKEGRLGSGSKIPTLLIAATSIDNVTAMTAFGIILGIASGGQSSLSNIALRIPLSIILGILLGLLVGYALVRLFNRYDIRDTKKTLLFLFVAILIYGLEKIIPISSLLAIITVGFVILEKDEPTAHRLALKFNKIWIFAEILLFVLIGAQFNFTALGGVAVKGLVIILIGLLGRSVGVLISLMGSGFKLNEKLFCVASYLPKATVQAAIAAIPLSMGIKDGDVILAIATLSIILTTPLGIVAPRLFRP